MALDPDTKDWTWVLERPCGDCGFDAGRLATEQIAGHVRATADAWRAVLAAPDDLVRRRPREDHWSALEYGCHVRDVFRIFYRRVELMPTTDDPPFANWDQDETALVGDYASQDPAVVALLWRRARPESTPGSGSAPRLPRRNPHREQKTVLEPELHRGRD